MIQMELNQNQVKSISREVIKALPEMFQMVAEVAERRGLIEVVE